MWSYVVGVETSFSASGAPLLSSLGNLVFRQPCLTTGNIKQSTLAPFPFSSHTRRPSPHGTICGASQAHRCAEGRLWTLGTLGWWAFLARGPQARPLFCLPSCSGSQELRSIFHTLFLYALQGLGEPRVGFACTALLGLDRPHVRGSCMASAHHSGQGSLRPSDEVTTSTSFPQREKEREPGAPRCHGEKYTHSSPGAAGWSPSGTQAPQPDPQHCLSPPLSATLQSPTVR